MVVAQYHSFLVCLLTHAEAKGAHAAPATIPTPTPAATPVAAASGAGDAAGLGEKITAQGEKVRTLKTAKKDKAEVDAAVKELLALKV